MSDYAHGIMREQSSNVPKQQLIELIGQRALIASQKAQIRNKRSDRYNQLHQRWDELNRRIDAIK